MGNFTSIYQRGNDDIIEITIKDPTGRKIESFIFNAHDKKAAATFDLIKQKYQMDVKPSIAPEDSPNDRNIIDEMFW